LEPFLRGAAPVGDEQADSKSTTGDPTHEADADQSPTSAAVDATARAEGIAISREDGEPVERVEGGESDETDPLAADAGVVIGDQVDGESVEPDEPAEVGAEPDQFRKVMRLLSNREFPVDRAEFAELTAGAYGMEDDHVARIIDHAVERGVIVDDAGTLRKD
jgi:hypothetical protein